MHIFVAKRNRNQIVTCSMFSNFGNLVNILALPLNLFYDLGSKSVFSFSMFIVYRPTSLIFQRRQVIHILVI